MRRDQPARPIDRPAPCFLSVRLADGSTVPARITRRLGVLSGELVRGGESEVADVAWLWETGDLLTQDEWNALVADRARGRPF